MAHKKAALDIRLSLGIGRVSFAEGEIHREKSFKKRGNDNILG